MRTNPRGTHRGKLNWKVKLAVLVLPILPMLGGLPVAAQAAPTTATAGQDVVQTFYLSNVMQSNEAVDLLASIRNILSPSTKVILLSEQNAITVRGTPEEMKLVQKLLNDLDRPRKSYRLTYTITESDAGKRIGVQHFSIMLVTGQRTVLKNGSRVPVVTGSYSPGAAGTQTQFTYLDVGINIDATLDEFASGARLRSKVEQSSVAPESGVGAQDPVVRQSVMEGTAILTPGKTVMLGSLDITGSTRHLDVEVMMEPAR